MISLVRVWVLLSAFTFLSSCDPDNPSSSGDDRNSNISFGLASSSQLVTEETPANFKVAFLGDSGKNRGYERVLELIKSQGAHMVIHVGDFAYGSAFSQRYGSKKWNEKVNQVLGESFPYFILVGNHESFGWHHYIKHFSERLKHLPQGTCLVESGEDDLGVKSYCQYKGIFFLLSGVGSKGRGHESFIEEALSRYQKRPWKVCAWHKNQTSLQLGRKTNEVGWKPYELCQASGAFIVAGHEHSYGRTKTLVNISASSEKEEPGSTFEKVTLAPGKTFSAVVGTGGKSLRPYGCLKDDLDSWWASLYTTNYVVKNGMTLKAKDCLHPNPTDDQETSEYGVLFVTFNHNGEKNKGLGEFVTTNGRVLDEFEIHRDDSN